MSTPPSSQESLNWKREEPIDLPKPESEGRLAIRHQDWKRLKTRIQRIENRGPNLQVVYSILFGFAGSTLLSLITFETARELSPWVKPLFICLFLFSLLCAFVFAAVEKQLKSNRVSEQVAIIEEMDEIQGAFIRKKGAQGPLNIDASEAKKNPAANDSETGEQEQ